MARTVPKIAAGSALGRAAAGGVGAELGGHAADAVLVEEMAEAAHGEVEDFGRARLVAARAPQGFEEVRLLKVFEVRDEIQALLGQARLRRADRRGVVVG